MKILRKIESKISSKTLAKVCVRLLVLWLVLTLLWAGYLEFLVRSNPTILGAAYLVPDNKYSILAALFAANAGTALWVGLAFGLPEFSQYTSRMLRLVVGLIGAASVLLSATFWIADGVENWCFRLAMVAPFLATLLMLMCFIRKADEANKERPNNEGEDEVD